MQGHKSSSNLTSLKNRNFHHKFNHDNTKILGKENHYYPRCIIVMINTKKIKNSINTDKTDIANL